MSIRRILLVVLGVVALLALYVAGAWYGLYGRLKARGRRPRRPSPRRSSVSAVPTTPAAAALSVVPPDKQILFGDFHVHTTFRPTRSPSPADRAGRGRPSVGGCLRLRPLLFALDFWSINDHAENMTPAQWDETVASIRECNAVAGEGEPDTVAFLGWEWTNVGATPDEHWGHKNVVMRGIGEDEVPARPISSAGTRGRHAGGRRRVGTRLMALRGAMPASATDFARFLADRARTCPAKTAST